MAPYDSDSSGDEGDADYSKTNVVLGFAAKESAEQVDAISHLGGRPVSCFYRHLSSYAIGIFCEKGSFC